MDAIEAVKSVSLESGIRWAILPCRDAVYWQLRPKASKLLSAGFPCDLGFPHV
jgi:hypothetical protein